MKYITKIAALYLFWYVLVFILVVVDLNFNFLAPEIKNFLARYPYQWDYELMFSTLFLVWGIFLWRSSKNETFVKFSGIAFIVQGITIITLGFLRQAEASHFFIDSILWLILGFILLNSKNYGK